MKKQKFQNYPPVGVQLTKSQLNQELAKNSIKTKIQNIDVYTPYEMYQTQKSFMTYVIKCLNKSQPGVIQSPTGTGKTMSLLGSTLAWQYNKSQQSIHNYKQTDIPQILYTSRTHQQLKQSISELKKFPYQIKMCVLSSRDQSCINLDLKQLKGKDLGFQCRKRIVHQQGNCCSFYKNDAFYDELIKNNAYNNKVMDLDEIIFRGKCQKFCPYYYNKNMKNKAHIVFMPYNYLFQDSKILQQNGIQLRNSILIIDQAHNIQQTLQRSKQYTLTLNILDRAVSQISQIYEQKLSQLKSQKIISQYSTQSFVDQNNKKKKNQINSSLQSIQYHASYIQMIHYYFQTLDIPIGTEGKNFGIKEFVEIIENATKDSQFGVITKKLTVIVKELKSLRSDLMFRPFWALEGWTYFVEKMWELYQIYTKNSFSSQYKLQLLYEGSDIKLNIFCLDPSTAMQQILNHKPHSIILTSGTLSPIKSFMMQLKLQSIQPASCPHIISPGQAKTYIISRGPNIALNFSYQNRFNSKMYQQLGLVLTQIIKNTPNGVVVFFPSYQLLEQAKNGLTAGKMLSKIYQYKSLYIEKKQNTQFNQILQGYLRDAHKPKGAVLFALIRGKISQGLDFSDQKCRAVIIVGVPYPARKDIKVISKMQYLNELCQKQAKDVITGQQWYLSQAIRSINQGIGRIIRHKKDHGNIYLLDERFQKQKPDLKGQLSSWAKSSLTVIDKYYDLADQFKRKKQEMLIPLQSKNNPLENFKSISGQLKSNDSQHNQKQQKQKVKFTSLKSMLSEIKSKAQENNTKKFQQPIKQQKPIQPIQQKQKQKQKQKQQQKDIVPKYLPLSQQKSQNHSPSSPFTKYKVTFNKDKKIIPIDQLQQCPICRLNVKLIGNTACIHRICNDCWKIWLEKDLRCPLCRIRIREKFLITDQ